MNSIIEAVRRPSVDPEDVFKSAKQRPECDAPEAQAEAGNPGYVLLEGMWVLMVFSVDADGWIRLS